MKFLLVLVFGAILTEIAGYLLHRVLHSSRLGSLHTAHLSHHTVQYPPNDFLGPVYRSAGSSSTLYPFLAVGVVLAGLLMWLAPLWLALPLILDLAVVGAINDRVHGALHIRGHWLERFEMFHYLRYLHWIHHEKMVFNYGIVTFGTDKAVGTFIS